jgi:hypothetical protein
MQVREGLSPSSSVRFHSPISQAHKNTPQTTPAPVVSDEEDVLLEHVLDVVHGSYATLERNVTRPKHAVAVEDEGVVLHGTAQNITESAWGREYCYICGYLGGYKRRRTHLVQNFSGDCGVPVDMLNILMQRR